MLFAVAACGDDPYDGEFEPVQGPAQTDTSLVWVENDLRELVFVTPEDDHVSVRRASFGGEGRRIAWTRPTVEGDGLLALIEPDDDKLEDVEEQLLVFPSNGDGDFVAYDVMAPFTSLTLSPDGRLAVLHFAGGEGSGVIQNANQVAVVDLESQALFPFTLNGFGGVLRSVEFPAQRDGSATPGVMVGDTRRNIVAFLASEEIVLVDVADSAADQVAVRFSTDGSFAPRATLLRPADDIFPNPVLFLRADQASDVAMVTLVDKPDVVSGAAGFSAQISLLPIGNQAADFVTHNGEGVPYLVTLDPNRSSIVFADIRTQESFSVALTATANHLFVREHDVATGTVPQLVAWAEGGRAIHTLDLDGIGDALGRSPRRLTVQNAIQDLVVLDNDRALASSGSDGVLFVIDFRTEQVTPLTTQQQFDPGNAHIQGDTLLLGAQGQASLSSIDLVTLNPESMALDVPIASFHFLPASAKVAVVHDHRAGYVTVADATDLSRSTSYSAWGFLYEGVYER